MTLRRVLVAAPAPLASAIAVHLGRIGAEVTTDPASPADAVVFAPASTGPRADAVTPQQALAGCGAAARAGARHGVLISSAAVYGASPYAPGLADEAWQAPPVYPNRVAGWWTAFERDAARLFGDAEVTVLRPAPLLDGTSSVSRLLRGRVAFTVAGYDPPLQLLSVDDLAAAVARVLERPAPGIFNVAPAEAISLSAALRAASRLRVPLPHPSLRLAKGDEAEFLRFPSTVSAARIAAVFGFRPLHSSLAAVRAFVGASGDEREQHFDPFGQDRRYIDRYSRSLFTFLSRYYWRIETEGIEALPAHGRAVLSGPHRGFMPFDGVMLLHHAVRARGRYVRFLIHPSLMKFPFLFDFMLKLGGIPACRENADWILRHDEIAGIFPEGIHGAFTPYRSAYRLGRFGRDEYVRAALRNGAPIVPFATVGSAEIFPILARVRWPWWERLTDWPCFPITPTFPLAPLPLPSKWHIRFLPALDLAPAYTAADADNPRAVRAVSADIRARIQSALDEMLARRRWIFFGSVFEGKTDATR
jgi:1-acyl-sn-glycerol-3-phosphate acyltransferase